MTAIPHRKSTAWTCVTILTAILLASGCTDRRLPIEGLEASLADAATYSIILENMKEEGNFFKSYYHQYRVVQPEGARTTKWLEVPETYYRKNEEFLGMTLAGKKEGEDINGANPPGYAYVGDPRYGRWRDDGSGGSFWEFYGKYRLLTDFFGGWYRPVYREDYHTYERYRSRNIPYLGRDRQFGTRGSVAKENKPDFFARRMAKEQAKKTSFSDRVSKRIGRTRTGFRSRAGGRGK
jgi:hypothetical protein